MEYLVALDGSERAPAVLHAAVTLARRTGARLWLLRTVGLPLEIPNEAYSMAPETLPSFLMGHAHCELRTLAEEVPAEMLAGTQVALGVPWQTICESAEELAVGLIVIGSHGYRGLDRLMGTTAAKVTDHASRSVLVVRTPELFEPQSTLAESSLRPSAS